MPLDPPLPLLKATPLYERAQLKLYQELIGSSNHLAVSNAVSQLSQFLQEPIETHMKAARHVLHYLKGTRSLSITYGRDVEIFISGEGE